MYPAEAADQGVQGFFRLKTRVTWPEQGIEAVVKSMSGRLRMAKSGSV